MKLQKLFYDRAFIPIPLYFLLCENLNDESKCKKYSILKNAFGYIIDINDIFYYEYRDSNGSGSKIGYTNKNKKSDLEDILKSTTFRETEIYDMIRNIISIDKEKQIEKENLINDEDFMRDYYNKYNELSSQKFSSFKVKKDDRVLLNAKVYDYRQLLFNRYIDISKSKQDKINIKKSNNISQNIIEQLQKKDDYTDEIREIINRYNNTDNKNNFQFGRATDFIKKYITFTDDKVQNKSKSKNR
jgi:hypothetical protein